METKVAKVSPALSRPVGQTRAVRSFKRKKKHTVDGRNPTPVHSRSFVSGFTGLIPTGAKRISAIHSNKQIDKGRS